MGEVYRTRDAQGVEWLVDTTMGTRSRIISVNGQEVMGDPVYFNATPEQIIRAESENPSVAEVTYSHFSNPAVQAGILRDAEENTPALEPIVPGGPVYNPPMYGYTGETDASAGSDRVVLPVTPWASVEGSDTSPRDWAEELMRRTREFNEQFEFEAKIAGEHRLYGPPRYSAPEEPPMPKTFYDEPDPATAVTVPWEGQGSIEDPGGGGGIFQFFSDFGNTWNNPRGPSDPQPFGTFSDPENPMGVFGDLGNVIEMMTAMMPMMLMMAMMGMMGNIGSFGRR